MVEDDEMVGGSNNKGQKLAESRKSKNYQNSAKSRNSNHPKLSKFKKAILDKSEILVNLTMATNTSAMGYLTPKAKVTFTQLR